MWPPASAASVTTSAVVVDIDAYRLRQLGTELDVLTVEGSGTHPSVLSDAGLDRCELVVAVTSNDEVNLVASLIAKQRGVDKTIVRIEAEELRSRASAELRQTFQADLVIDPDHQTAERIPEPARLSGCVGDRGDGPW